MSAPVRVCLKTPATPVCYGGVTAVTPPARLGHAMTSTLPPAEHLDGVQRVLEPAFRLDRLVAATPERVVYHAWDRVLRRHVALHAHLAPDAPGRAWFLRETETLAALDHPTIRHVYAAAIQDTLAYRTTNWVEGESLADALRRGPRPIPTAHTLVRDLLGAAEHAHARGVILRRIVPLTLMLEPSGRAVITDLRYANWCLPNVPPEERGATTTSCSRRSARVDSGGCTARATSGSSATSPSRCCTPRSRPMRPCGSGSTERPSSPRGCGTRASSASTTSWAGPDWSGTRWSSCPARTSPSWFRPRDPSPSTRPCACLTRGSRRSSTPTPSGWCTGT